MNQCFLSSPRIIGYQPVPSKYVLNVDMVVVDSSNNVYTGPLGVYNIDFTDGEQTIHENIISTLKSWVLSQYGITLLDSEIRLINYSL